MKNIHLIKTDKPSKLYLNGFQRLLLDAETESGDDPSFTNQNIYITSDEEIKANVYCLINGALCKTELLEDKIVSRQLVGGATMDICKSEYSEIILTTDQDLIKDGVQAIDDEFLEWFVKHPKCNWVEVNDWLDDEGVIAFNGQTRFQIIIPKEEPKKYPIGGYAPGSYFCKCITCNNMFIGDKRAYQCEPCAIKIDDFFKSFPSKQETLEEPTEKAKQRAKNYMSLKGALEPKQIKCYCGHTTYCDCSPLEEPKDVVLGYKTSLDAQMLDRIEPKQETLEEAAENFVNSTRLRNYKVLFIEGAKWQQKQDKKLYSEEDMLNFAWFLKENLGQYSCDRTAHFEGKYLEQFKKK